MKIDRIPINEGNDKLITTDHAFVDKCLRLAVQKLNVAGITGDFLLHTSIILAMLCQKLYNELDELRGKETNHETGTGDVPAEAE